MERLAKIKLLAMDVDGVLTDGSMVLGPIGDIKLFNVLDGLGINLAISIGLEVAWITGNVSQAVADRARVLGVTELHQGARLKSVALRSIAEKRGLSFEEIAYIGDDLNDIPAIELAGVSFTVPNASDDVKDAVDFITDKPGGRGAVREVIEKILRTQGKWEEGVQVFLARLKSEQERGEAPGQVT